MEIRRWVGRSVGVWVVIMLLTSCTTTSPSNTFQRYWADYVGKFYQDGRIVDTGNAEVTHSEGQGYGMLMAVQADDRARFDALWKWTQAVLQRDDDLFSWRYRPCISADVQCVDDPNNASDGEILIAWALLRAVQKWQIQEYEGAALRIIDAIKRHLVVEHNEQLLLLPGLQGFQSGHRVQVNLSYYIFPAFSHFAQVTKDPFWLRLSSSGYHLIRHARFQMEQLNPDWVFVEDNTFSLANAVNQEFGFNAWRIPLHLVWENNFDYALVEPYLKWWQTEWVPATLNLVTGEKAEFRATWGMQAIQNVVEQRALVLHAIGNSNQLGISTSDSAQGSLPSDVDYYSASLFMLALIALQDTQ